MAKCEETDLAQGPPYFLLKYVFFFLPKKEKKKYCICLVHVVLLPPSGAMSSNAEELHWVLCGGSGVSEVQRSKNDGSSATQTKVFGCFVPVVYLHLVMRHTYSTS